MRFVYRNANRTHSCQECSGRIESGQKCVYVAYGGNVIHFECIDRTIESIAEFTREQRLKLARCI